MSSYGVCPRCGETYAAGAQGLCRHCYDHRRLHGDDEQELGRSRKCASCGIYFELERDTARFCSPKCRLRWHRQHPGVQPPETPMNRATIDTQGRIHNHPYTPLQ